MAVRRTRISVGYKVEWSTPKTERGRRNVALDPATVEALRTHRKRQLEERLAFGPAYADTDGLVFTREDGVGLHPERVSQMFDNVVAAAKLPRIRLHDLRHTHATLALQAGINPKVVSDRLGHHSAGFTLDVYSHARAPGAGGRAGRGAGSRIVLSDAMSFTARGTYAGEPAELRWNGSDFEHDGGIGTEASAMVAANVTVSLGGLWSGRSGDGELGARATADVLLTDAVFDPPAEFDPVPPGAIP